MKGCTESLCTPRGAHFSLKVVLTTPGVAAGAVTVAEVEVQFEVAAVTAVALAILGANAVKVAVIRALQHCWGDTPRPRQNKEWGVPD